MSQDARGPHEATLYRKADENLCDCFLCSHRCQIKPGQRGVCRVRENRAGTLYTLVYGKLIAAHVDPIEKKPLYHFLPGTSSFSIATVGCNFQCDFCQNWQISQAARENEIAGEFTTPEEVVAAAKSRALPEHLVHVHRADDLFRVRRRLRAAGEGRRPPQRLRDERLPDARDDREDGRAD